MVSPTFKNSKKRAHNSTTNQCLHDDLSWFDEHAALYESRLDALLAKPVARMNLPDLLWRMGPKLVDAINRGHTGRELWALCKDQCSYRTFARALAKFRDAKGLPPAYAGQKSKAATPKSVLGVLNPSRRQTETPHSVPTDSSQETAKDATSPVMEEQSGNITQTSARSPTGGASLQAFLKKRFANQYDPNVPQKTLEEMDLENMRDRETRALAAAEAEKAEAERRRHSGRRPPS